MVNIGDSRVIKPQMSQPAASVEEWLQADPTKSKTIEANESVGTHDTFTLVNNHTDPFGFGGEQPAPPPPPPPSPEKGDMESQADMREQVQHGRLKRLRDH